jgi:hypothetical protein
MSTDTTNLYYRSAWLFVFLPLSLSLPISFSPSFSSSVHLHTLTFSSLPFLSPHSTDMASTFVKANINDMIVDVYFVTERNALFALPYNQPYYYLVDASNVTAQPVVVKM